MNDALIPPNIIPVNDNPLTLNEAGLDSLCNAVARGFGSVRVARAQADSAIAFLERAANIARAANLQETTDLGGDLDAIVVALVRALEALADAQGVLELNCAANEAITAAGESGGAEVAGYLAVGPATSDRVIEDFITAVGAGRALDALDRLTAPVKINNAN